MIDLETWVSRQHCQVQEDRGGGSLKTTEVQHISFSLTCMHIHTVVVALSDCIWEKMYTVTHTFTYDTLGVSQCLLSPLISMTFAICD